MTGSKLHPRIGYKTGKIETGGYLKKNASPKSASSPDWRGMFYLEGYGWIFLNGWSRKSGGPPMIRLTGKDMADEDTEKYCAPKQAGATPAERHQPNQNNGQHAAESDDSGIPF